MLTRRPCSHTALDPTRALQVTRTDAASYTRAYQLTRTRNTSMCNQITPTPPPPLKRSCSNITMPGLLYFLINRQTRAAKVTGFDCFARECLSSHRNSRPSERLFILIAVGNTYPGPRGPNAAREKETAKNNSFCYLSLSRKHPNVVSKIS